MTNREKYAKEMLGMLGYGIAVDKKTGKPAICEHIKCINCLFYDEHDCAKTFKEWLDAEYVEPIKTIKASELAVDTRCCVGIMQTNARGILLKLKMENYIRTLMVQQVGLIQIQ